MNTLLYECSIPDYHADKLGGGPPTLSASIANLLVTRSPAHAWEAHPRLGGRPGREVVSEDGEVDEPESREEKKATDDMRAGTIVHALVLGRGEDAIEVVPSEELATNGAMTTKAARARKDAAKALGRVAIAEPKMARYERAADHIRAELRRRKIDIDPKASEVAMLWEETADDGTIVQCRGLVDNLLLTSVWATLLDLKTGADASPLALPRKVLAFGSDLQAAAYSSGFAKIRPALAGFIDFRWLFCELRSPYAVVVAKPSGEMRELGARRWRRAVNLWARCLHDNSWPAYPDEIVSVEPPPWALEQEMNQ